MKNIRFNFIQLILIVYIVLSIIFSIYLDNVKIYTLLFRPLVLLVVVVYLFFYTHNNHGRFPNQKENMKTMLIISLMYVIVYYLSGLIFTFAKNPYNIKNFFVNFYQMVFPLILIEYIRSALVNENKNSKFMYVIFSIVFTLMQINYFTFFGTFGNREAFFKYICSFIVPLIFSNVVYNYLTIKGSYKLILVHVIITQTLTLIVPILPNLDWFLLGIYEIIIPVVMFIIFRYDLNRRQERRFSRKKTKFNPVVYVPLLSILIVFVLFMVGVFKYEPIAILSNSMTPVYYRGDIVIYSKPTDEELKKIEKDTIIIYSREKQIVAHRVIEVREENGNLSFVTKGDANLTPDGDPVPADKVIGVYSCSIKYIGYPSVWLYQIFNDEKPTVEIK